MKSFNFNLSTWSAPHWLALIGSAALAAAVSYLVNIPADQLVTGLATSAGWAALGKGLLVAVVAAVLPAAKTLLPAPEQAAHAAGSEVKIAGAVKS